MDVMWDMGYGNRRPEDQKKGQGKTKERKSRSLIAKESLLGPNSKGASERKDKREGQGMQHMQYDGCEFNTEPQKNQVEAQPKPEYSGGNQNHQVK